MSGHHLVQMILIAAPVAVPLPSSSRSCAMNDDPERAKLTPGPEMINYDWIEAKDTAMRDNVRKLALAYAEHDPLTEIERLTLG